MKRDLGQLRKQHTQTANCEISTVADAVNVDQRLRLVELYGQLNLDRAAESELNRLRQKFPQHQAVLAAMLGILSDRKMIALLTPVVSLSQKISNPCPALRLAMARALIVIKRFDAAAAQYAELIKARELIPQLSQQLAGFVCVHPPTPVLIKALNAYILSLDNDYLPALLYYVLCRVLETQDYPNIDVYLDRIRARDIRQSDIAFDIARLSFRYCKWFKAVAAAKRVLMISPENESAMNILVSAYSFAGRLDKAANCIRKMFKSYSPLVLSVEQVSKLLTFAAKQHKHLPATDVASSQDGLEDTYSEIAGPPEEQNQRITVSMIGAVRANARPWDILVKSDWLYPLIMVQKLDVYHILHAFVPSDGPDCWRWHEVPIFIRGGQLDKGDVLFIPAELDLCNRSAPAANNLFQQVERELESDYIRKEYSNA